jgi:hypothetical protein
MSFVNCGILRNQNASNYRYRSRLASVFNDRLPLDEALPSMAEIEEDTSISDHECGIADAECSSEESEDDED